MLDVLDMEKGLALADTLTGAGERIAAGETVSGPAADRYRAAAAELSGRYRALSASGGRGPWPPAPASRSAETGKPA
ncbi:hypothetical protein AB0L74_29390 [Streptomyces sp. NPDC052020]|uniref:hypothetical protein n=1 Tax=Streptomyces sp. NPDC052020 TaxID=3155677 RepID=UPI0034248C59